MDDIGFHLTVLALAVLAYALITGTLVTLAARVRQERLRHDLIRTARQRRAEYLNAIAHRTGKPVEAEIEEIAA